MIKYTKPEMEINKFDELDFIRTSIESIEEFDETKAWKWL